MTEYFKILNLEYDTSEKEIKKAFRSLSKKYHPDMNSGSNQYVEEFWLIKEAYEKLLIFIKSNRYESWRKSKSSKKTKGDFNTSKPKNREEFNYYEFVIDFGLFEEDLFEEQNNFSIKKQYSTLDKIDVGFFSYLIKSFEYKREFGKDLFKAKSDGYFLIINIEIQNISKELTNIHNYMFRVFDIEGFFYEFSSEGLSKMALNQENIIPFFGKEQNPKIKSNYKLIFEVPEIDSYFLQLCGGKHQFNEKNICICDEIETVKLKNHT